VDMVA